MALTKKDIEKLSDVFLTKADAFGFATKDDLNRFITKDEFLTAMDKVMKKLEDLSIEHKMMYAQYKRHDEKLDNHETRIGALEAKV